MAAVVGLQMLGATGCGYLQSKKCCPVYSPQDHLIGSEAVRMTPCGAEGQFYGLKKTSWREWPAEWELWQSSPCPPYAMEMLPLATPESSEPVKVERLQPVSPESRDVPAEADPEPDNSAEPPRKIDPFDLFGPIEGEEGTTPGASPPQLDRIEPGQPAESSPPAELGPPAESGPPATLPRDPPPSSVKPSSWSMPYSKPARTADRSANPTQLDRIEPGQPAELGQPATLPHDPPTSSVKPSSWSMPYSKPARTADRSANPTQLQLPSSWFAGSNFTDGTNTRAPRPSKFRR